MRDRHLKVRRDHWNRCCRRTLHIWIWKRWMNRSHITASRSFLTMASPCREGKGRKNGKTENINCNKTTLLENMTYTQSSAAFCQRRSSLQNGHFFLCAIEKFIQRYVIHQSFSFQRELEPYEIWSSPKLEN